MQTQQHMTMKWLNAVGKIWPQMPSVTVDVLKSKKCARQTSNTLKEGNGGALTMAVSRAVASGIEKTSLKEDVTSG